MKKLLCTSLLLSSMVAFNQAQATTWWWNIPKKPEINQQGTTNFQKWSDAVKYKAKVVAGKVRAEQLQVDVSRESDRCTGEIVQNGDAIVIHDATGKRVFQKLLTNTVTFGEYAVVYDHC